MRNIYRIIAVSIYPLILLITFFTIWRKKKYRKVITSNIKPLLLNTAFITIIFVLFIYLFLNHEHTIYSWDYSGHWVRSLTLRNIFFKNPQNLFTEVIKSLNQSDYSFLPALFTLPFSIINTSFQFFCVSNFLCFFIPLFILLQIVYFNYFNKYKYLPSLLFIVFYPLYYTLLEGKACGCGLLFLVASYLLIIFQDIENIDIIDALSINFFMYITIFERRWYLYSAFVFYLSFLIKYLLSLKTINNKIEYLFTRVIFSGIFLLIILILFNMPFLMKVLASNYSEIYSTYNKSGKLTSFINYYSIIICIISSLGFISLFKKNRILFIINLISIIISTAMFWKIQSFETHHYFISMINIIFVFTLGCVFIIDSITKYSLLVYIILLIQASLVFVNVKSIPIFTSMKRTPQQMDNINEYREFCHYMKNLLGDYDCAYICGSSSIFNEDIIRNSLLPDLDMPIFEYAQVDLVDGFPNDIDYIKYILIPKPFQYFDKNSQHVHEILAEAIENKEEFKKVYQLYDAYKIGSITVNIYEKQGEYTYPMKQYLFDEISKYYPNNQEIFKEILE